jgi:hypothetical protein
MSKINPVICERTIAYGNQRWRVNISSQWSVLMWGWWPDSNGTPSWRWQSIEENKVPNEIKRMI